jgi:hypothetical protein
MFTAMNLRSAKWLVAIAFLSATACQSPTPDPEATVDTADTAETTVAPPADLAEGVSLSADGQTVIMASGSTLETYCNDGQGMLAISAVGEAGGDFQALGCGQTFDGFDAARANGFADVTFVAPATMAGALQLQDGEYTKVQCLADHAGLAPTASENSDGHMNLECI